MGKQRTRWSKETKFKVAMEAFKGERSVTEIAAEYGVNPVQVHRWKKDLMERGPDLFGTKADRDRQAKEMERDDLFRTVGHQAVQIEFLKKKLGIDRLPNVGP